MSENPVSIDKEPKQEIFAGFINWCKLILILMILMKKNGGGLDTTSSKNLKLLIDIGFISIDNLDDLIQNIDLLGLAGPAKSENLKLLLEGNEPILIKENFGKLMEDEYFLKDVNNLKPATQNCV
jgi:hypothetical protein